MKGLPSWMSEDKAGTARHSDGENDDHDEAFLSHVLKAQTVEIIFMFALSERHLK